MEYNEVKKLLNKYAAAETSPEEEKALSEYFAQAAIHKDFEEWKPLFNYFSSEKNLTTSKGFDEKVLAEIRRRQGFPKIVKWYGRKITAAAAAVLLLSGIAGIIYKSTNKNQTISLQNTAQSSFPKKSDTVTPIIPKQNIAQKSPLQKNKVPTKLFTQEKKDKINIAENSAKHKNKLNQDEAKAIVEKALAQFSENWNVGKSIAMEKINKLDMDNGKNTVIENLNKFETNLNEGKNIITNNLN